MQTNKHQKLIDQKMATNFNTNILNSYWHWFNQHQKGRLTLQSVWITHSKETDNHDGESNQEFG